MSPGPLSVVFAPELAAVVGPGVELVGTPADVVARVESLERQCAPRWVWWSAEAGAAPLVAAGVRLRRCWDVAEAHRLLAGGWAADPALAWASVCRLSLDHLPRATAGDLLDFADTTGEAADSPKGDRSSAARPDGYLRPDAVEGSWLTTAARIVDYANALLSTAQAQEVALAELGIRAVSTAHAESAAALLCLELARDGLPIDRRRAEALIEASAGPRPLDDAHAARLRRERDAAVLRHVPGRDCLDLRNPAQVRELLASVGVMVSDTRAWRLEPFRAAHPLVDALLQWRKAERIATTYGWAWLAAHVGADDRLRGRWTSCDGAGGRMTAQSGLHNLPVPLRPAVAAAPGHVFVRADLGQVEPRVLAVVSGDTELAAATRADDLYAPVAARLGVERPVAKVAVLAAMYGQTSGAAGQALEGLEAAYPVAMTYLRRAYDAGVAGQDVRTFGGRLVRMWQPAAETAASAAMLAGRGRFARNAVVQGAAAELFKAWAATVRIAVAELSAQIVLCLHDELLLHVRRDAAEHVTTLVTTSLTDTARRWAGSDEVRFVADTSVVDRWSDAKT